MEGEFECVAREADEFMITLAVLKLFRALFNGEGGAGLAESSSSAGNSRFGDVGGVRLADERPPPS